MPSLWNKEQEKDFFDKTLECANPEKLFYYTNDRKFLAYWPKHYSGTKNTLQSRNAFIGSYTEKWCAALFSQISEIVGGYSVTKVVCQQIGLTNQSPADVAICKSRDIVQKPQNIILLIEVKMSVVWNWEYIPLPGQKFKLVCIGDYRTHQGNPGLLRSDTMLKAIGKSINIRVSSFAASLIPIIVVGNTPITNSYYEKVDHLAKNGIIQGFWSVNPIPIDTNRDDIKNTPANGFRRLDSYNELKTLSLELLKEDREFFSSMQSKMNLGKIIEIADREITYEAKAQRFLSLLRQENE